MKKAQNVLEIALIASVVVVVSIMVMLGYSKLTNKDGILMKMSKVTPRGQSNLTNGTSTSGSGVSSGGSGSSSASGGSGGSGTSSGSSSVGSSYGQLKSYDDATNSKK